jgi:hypothetical protein
MQRAIEGHAWLAAEQVRVRMGIHTGAAAKTETGLVGLEVHRAVRLAAIRPSSTGPASRGRISRRATGTRAWPTCAHASGSLPVT